MVKKKLLLAISNREAIRELHTMLRYLSTFLSLLIYMVQKRATTTRLVLS